MYKDIDMKCFPLLKGIWMVEVEQIILPPLTKTQVWVMHVTLKHASI